MTAWRGLPVIITLETRYQRKGFGPVEPAFVAVLQRSYETEFRTRLLSIEIGMLAELSRGGDALQLLTDETDERKE